MIGKGMSKTPRQLRPDRQRPRAQRAIVGKAASKMTKPRNGGEKTRLGGNGWSQSTPNHAIGRANFAKISAIERIHLSDEMRRDFREFDRKGLSAQARRRWIIAKYGKPR